MARLLLCLILATVALVRCAPEGAEAEGQEAGAATEAAPQAAEAPGSEETKARDDNPYVALIAARTEDFNQASTRAKAALKHQNDLIEQERSLKSLLSSAQDEFKRMEIEAETAKEQATKLERVAMASKIQAQQAAALARRAAGDAALQGDQAPVIQLTLTRCIQDARRSASAEEEAEQDEALQQAQLRYAGKHLNMLQKKLVRADRLKDIIESRWNRLQDRANKKAAIAKLWLAHQTMARTSALKTHAEAAKAEASNYAQSATDLANQLKSEAKTLNSAAGRQTEKAAEMSDYVAATNLAAVLASSRLDVTKMIPATR